MDQARAEGLCLRYPENLGLHLSITYDMAVTMLMKATVLSQQVPFSWGWIDQPSGQSILYLARRSHSHVCVQMVNCS